MEGNLSSASAGERVAARRWRGDCGPRQRRTEDPVRHVTRERMLQTEIPEMTMTLQTLAWLSMAAYALHIMEEYSFDWRNWARAVIKLPVEWSDFYVTNAIVIALGIAQAELAPALPFAPLTFASLMLINAVFFHIRPGAADARTVLAGRRHRRDPVFPGGTGRMVACRTRRRVGLDHGSIGRRRRRLADGLSRHHAEPTRPAVFSAGCRRAGETRSRLVSR